MAFNTSAALPMSEREGTLISGAAAAGGGDSPGNWPSGGPSNASTSSHSSQAAWHLIREREREKHNYGETHTNPIMLEDCTDLIHYPALLLSHPTLQQGISELCCAAEQPYSVARVWPSDAVHSDTELARTRLGLEYHHTKERAPYRPSITQSRRAAW